MKYLEWFQAFIDKYGLLGAGFMLLLLDRLRVYEKIKKFFNKEPELRLHKRDGDSGDEHLHRREVPEENKLLNEWIASYKLHLETAAKEATMIAVMQNDIANIKNNDQKRDEDIEKLYNLVSSMKDVLIGLGAGKK